MFTSRATNNIYTQRVNRKLLTKLKDSYEKILKDDLFGRRAGGMWTLCDAYLVFFSACVCASLSSVMAHIDVNDILCYLASARNSISKNEIIKITFLFFDDDAIIVVKYDVFKLFDEKNIARTS